MNDSLQNALVTLREQLKQAEPENDVESGLLENLSIEVELLLNPEKAKKTEEDEGLIDVMRETAEKLEASHPKMTNMLNNLANTLNGLGI